MYRKLCHDSEMKVEICFQGVFVINKFSCWYVAEEIDRLSLCVFFGGGKFWFQVTIVCVTKHSHHGRAITWHVVFFTTWLRCIIILFGVHKITWYRCAQQTVTIYSFLSDRFDHWLEGRADNLLASGSLSRDHCDLASRSKSSKRTWAYMSCKSLPSCQVWMR